MAEKSESYLIDVHHHGLPPFYKKLLDNMDVRFLGGGNPIVDWTPQVALDAMDANGIAASVILITGWTLYSTAIARQHNEYFAKLIQDHPTRFGAYGFIAFPDVNGALKEIEYSLDTLKLDGIAVLSNHNGHYLSDYDEVLAELNKRKAVVAYHAAVPPWGNPGTTAPGSPELWFDVLRLTANLADKALLKYPDIKFLIPFNGYATPIMAGTFTRGDAAKVAALKKMYYSPTGGEPASTLDELRDFFEPTKMLWASDFTIGDIARKRTSLAKNVKALRAYTGFSAKARAQIEHENALALFPRLKARMKK